MASAIQFSAVHYPESDGKPMGETDRHRNQMVRHIELLTSYFAGQRVYVSGDLLVYYEQGNPKKFVVPDAFVVKGLEQRDRRIYKIWLEGKAPDVVIETTSRKTRRKDLIHKPQLYARLGVKEYFLFDPDQEYLDPPLQGHRLIGQEFVQIEPDVSGALVSEELGLRLYLGNQVVQFERLDNGERLLDADERSLRDAAALEQADAARQRAEAEVARLRAELARRDRN